MKMKSILGYVSLAIASLSTVVAVAQPQSGLEQRKCGSTIVDVATAAGSFNTLLTAVKAAGLEDTLRSEGPFTVFAPTDAAFAKIPAEALNALLADKEALKNVLLYHVVAGKVPASVAVTLPSATMANGGNVSLNVIDGSLFVNSSKVTATDIDASNGVIHVIDSVLLPQ